MQTIGNRVRVNKPFAKLLATVASLLPRMSKVVVPGEVLGKSPSISGEGTYLKDGLIRAALVGVGAFDSHFFVNLTQRNYLCRWNCYQRHERESKNNGDSQAR